MAMAGTPQKELSEWMQTLIQLGQLWRTVFPEVLSEWKKVLTADHGYRSPSYYLVETKNVSKQHLNIWRQLFYNTKSDPLWTLLTGGFSVSDCTCETADAETPCELATTLLRIDALLQGLRDWALQEMGSTPCMNCLPPPAPPNRACRMCNGTGSHAPAGARWYIFSAIDISYTASMLTTGHMIERNTVSSVCTCAPLTVEVLNGLFDHMRAEYGIDNLGWDAAFMHSIKPNGPPAYPLFCPDARHIVGTLVIFGLVHFKPFLDWALKQSAITRKRWEGTRLDAINLTREHFSSTARVGGHRPAIGTTPNPNSVIATETC